MGRTPSTLVIVLISVLAAANGLPAQVTLSFEDATAASGVIFEHHDAPPLPGLYPFEQTRYGSGAAVSDYDRDGDLDLYCVDSYGYSNRLFANDGIGNFEDVTDAAGVGDLGAGHMALFLDLDNDGYDDLVVMNDTNGQAPLLGGGFPFSQIYQNNGDGTFSNMSAGSGFEPVLRTVGGATASDYDRDGDLDLYVVSWFDDNNYLYRNDGGFLFTDVTEAAGLRIPETFVPHWTPVFVDVDGDGWQDLFCAADFLEDYLFRNQGDGTFAYVPGTYHVGNDMGVAVADFDRDGDVDLYTTNITSPYDPYGCCNWLYVNDGNGTFENQAEFFEISDSVWGWGVSFIDPDLDGDLDLLAVNGWQLPLWDAPAYFYRNDGNQEFVEAAASCGLDHEGNSRSLIPFDYDGDGDVDVLITDILSPFTLYENTTPRDDRHWLTVRLEGRRSNRNGVGARVFVTVDGDVRMHEIVVGGSFYAGPPLEAHFGLGTADLVEELRILWPTGEEQVFTDVAVDRVLRIPEPRDPPATIQLTR